MRKENKGYIFGGTARFGYLKDPNNKGKLVIDPVASEYVKRIFTLYESGMGTTTIARMLNEENIPKPSIYKQMYVKPNYKSSAITTSKWTDKIIRQILIESMYTGTMVQGRRKKLNYKVNKEISVPKSDWYVVEDTHEAIIPKEQFERVQDIMKKRTRAAFTGKRNIFAGIIRCKKCGARMRKIKNGSGNYYYKCNKAMSPIFECSPLHRILHKDLEELVLSRIREKIIKYCDFDNISVKTKEKDEENKITRLEIAKLKLEVENLVKAISSLYLDKINGVISDDEFFEIKESFEIQKESKKKSINELKGKLESNSRKVDENLIKRILEDYKNINMLNSEIVDLFIDKILIGEKMKGQKQVVEIYWKF